MFNKIKRNHHFESNGQSYTAYINLDADMEVVDRGLPAISIKMQIWKWLIGDSLQSALKIMIAQMNITMLTVVAGI